METVFGKLLSDIASFATQKWYVAMMFIGLFIFGYAILNDTPYDGFLTAGIGFTLMFFGFFQAESRTYQVSVGDMGRHGLFKIERPVRQMNFTGIVLLFTALAGLMATLWRAYVLFVA